MQKDVYLFITLILDFTFFGLYAFLMKIKFIQSKRGTSSASVIVCLKNPKIELSKQ